ncbi:hypothetical protein TNCV_2899681, partial [Trichonephila clavipes]
MYRPMPTTVHHHYSFSLTAAVGRVGVRLTREFVDHTIVRVGRYLSHNSYK